MGLRTVEDGKEKQLVGLTVVLPEGMNSAGLGNFDHKAFVRDLLELKLRPDALSGSPHEAVRRRTRAKTLVGRAAVGRGRAAQDPRPADRDDAQAPQARRGLQLSCTADVENDGHRFGEDLPDADKKALIAFLATL